MTRAERRRKMREGQTRLNEIRTEIDAAGPNPTTQQWLDAVEMTGFYYEYLVKPDGDAAIYGLYEDVEHTKLFGAIAAKGDEPAGLFVGVAP